MMNEEKEKMQNDPKENTLDILVSPKKKEEAAPSPAPRATEKKVPVRAPQALRTPAPASPAKKIQAHPQDRTRAIHHSKTLTGRTTAEIAEATRVGGVGMKTDAAPAAGPVKVTKSKGKADAREAARKSAAAWKDSFRSTIARTLIYMAIVVGISAILSVVAIRWANDIFALVKDEVVATVTLPENATISDVADILGEKKIIEYPFLFRMYIGFKNRDNKDGLVFKPGDHQVNSTLNYDQLVSLMKNRKTRSIIKLTIPEGYTVDEIIELFLSNGMGTREGFVDAINNYPYSYDFVKKLDETELSKDRRYRLEGYLFPDTYEFYTDSKEIALVDKMLAAFENRFEEEYYERLKELNMSLDEMITLASIVQMEGKYNSDFYPISGVFHNRLKSRDLKKLESDATVQYCLAERKENLSYADLEVDNPYNTYLYPNLPPSAIANPGWEAIMAAMYPENNKYYYFVADTDGSTLFAKSVTEHRKNVADVAKAKANGTSVD